MIGGSTQNLTATLREKGQREIEFAREKIEGTTPSSTAIPSGGGLIRWDHHRPDTTDINSPNTQTGYMQVLNCQGNHRYFVAETFAVEGEGTVGAVIICTACGESKLITHKVGREGCSVLLNEKGEKR